MSLQGPYELNDGYEEKGWASMETFNNIPDIWPEDAVLMEYTDTSSSLYLDD